MDASLLRLMEDLIDAFERRETAEPGDRVGQVAARIRCLELQIAERLAPPSHAGAIAPAEPEDPTRHHTGAEVAGSVA